MSKEKTKKSNVGKIVTISICTVLIFALILLIMYLPKNTEPKAVMELNVNPNAQFLLDKNNKVVGVNYLNDDAEAILKDVKFEGKSAEDAAKLFVQITTEAGHINVSAESEGTKVSITVSCENPENYKELKTKLVSKVNEYFDENGIIAGAVADVKANLSEAVQKIGVKANELLNKSAEEILNKYKEATNNVKNVARKYQTQLLTFIEELKSGEAFKNLPTLEESISNIQKQLNDSKLPEKTKTELNKQLENIKKEYKELKNKFQAEIDKKITELEQLSKEVYETAKVELDKAIEATKQVLKTSKEYFNAHKDAVNAAIKAYRETLKAA